MARKKKRLPPDFEQRLEADDLPALRASFDACEIDARGGFRKQVALAFETCPDALADWLVAQGADLEAPHGYGATPLQTRARSRHGTLAGLLALGADIHAGEGGRGTPLHQAAETGRAANVHALLAHGARLEARNAAGQTPLESALRVCRNIDIPGVVEVASVLRAAGAPCTPRVRELVTRIGTEFEFHRDRLDAAFRDQTSAALDRLYDLLETPPVARQAMRDGTSPIEAPPGPWSKRFEALWVALVPSSGAAATVQGEVVRIPGRIADELARNAGGNWDADYRRMANAWLRYVATGTALPPTTLAEAKTLVAGILHDDGAPERLRALAVDWVDLNPQPMPLPPPPYRR